MDRVHRQVINVLLTEIGLMIFVKFSFVKYGIDAFASQPRKQKTNKGTTEDSVCVEFSDAFHC